MQWFYNLKTGYKLAVVFGICLTATGLVGTIAIQRFHYMDTVADMIKHEALPGTVTISKIGMETRALRVREIRFITEPPQEKRATEIEMHEAIQGVDFLLEDYNRNVTQNVDRKNTRLLIGEWLHYRTLHDELVSFGTSGTSSACFRLYNSEMKTVFKDELSDTVDKMLDWNSARGIRAVEDVKRSNAAVRYQIVVLLFLGVVLSGLAAWFMTRLLMGTLAQLANAADGLARGDAHQEVDLYSNDEIGQVANAFRMLIAYHQEMAGVAESIAGGDLSRRVVAKSDDDVLGQTFNRMIVNIQELLEAVTMKSGALEDSEKRYRSVVDNVTDVIFSLDVHGHCKFLNPAWTTITGFPVDESIGQSFAHFVADDDRMHIISRLELLHHTDEDQFRHEIRFRTRDNRLCWVEARIQSTFDLSGSLTGCFGTLSDITERKESETLLHHRALHDSLTDLPNRLLFQDRLRGAIGRIRPDESGVAVLFLDLDNFKGSMGNCVDFPVDVLS